MSFYQVTLNQGRSDNIIVEANSLNDIKTFFNNVSTASITSIKKIVYSKSLNIGSFQTSYVPNNQNKFLNVMVKNENNKITVLDIQHPKKNIDKDLIVKTIKDNLLIEKSSIIQIINIVIKK